MPIGRSSPRRKLRLLVESGTQAWRSQGEIAFQHRLSRGSSRATGVRPAKPASVARRHQDIPVHPYRIVYHHSLEIDVFHAQLQAFLQPQAGAV